MEILNNLKNLLISPRFITWYINTGFMLGAEFINMVSENISGLGLTPTIAGIVGLLFAQISKALRNQADGKPMGFAPKYK